MLNSGQSSLCNRRRFLGLLGSFVGGAYLLGKQQTQAKEPKKKFNIPAEWLEQSGQDVIRYANYIDSLQLKHITAEMVLAAHYKVKDGVKNSLPPRYMWKRIEPTLRVIDQLATNLGNKTPELYKMYRSPRFIKALKGSLKSQYMKNTAVAVKFDVPTEIVANQLRKMRKQGIFKGGVGKYKTFVHIDTRGHNVDW